MFDSHEWNQVEGKGEIEDLTLLALSTCGFCKRARAFLDAEGWAYGFTDIDKLKSLFFTTYLPFLRFL